uniref:Uncharacterized protein n=1 Tax=Oryza barthii TaxID=65489 RepID=A0A0D3FVI5_9ORYZ
MCGVRGGIALACSVNKHSDGTPASTTTLAQTARGRPVTAAGGRTASCRPMQSGARRARWQLLLRPCTNRAEQSSAKARQKQSKVSNQS